MPKQRAPLTPAPERHRLRIVSLHDGEAVCSCGRWEMLIAGPATRAHIHEQWKLHARHYRTERKAHA